MKNQLITSSHRYQPVYGFELPPKERKWWEGLIDKDMLDEWEFVYYRHSWYPLSDCMRIDEDMLYHFPKLKGWDGYFEDTYFSMVVCRYDEERESWQFGMYFGGEE